MPPEVIVEITKYGYLAIFILIFLQETGVPNPIPNELVLLFCGYLTFTGALFFPLVILSAVVADFTGTNILYVVFYFFGNYILNHKPRWLPVSKDAINKLEQRISSGGKKMVYIGRITPFIRGYTSVACGLIQLKPKIFLPIALFSGITWSLVYVLLGRLIAPYWDAFSGKEGWFKSALIIFAIGILLFLLIRTIINRKRK
ncbi:MAG: DedA family protein [Chitinophagaceae bacterium]